MITSFCFTILYYARGGVSVGGTNRAVELYDRKDCGRDGEGRTDVLPAHYKGLRIPIP